MIDIGKRELAGLQRRAIKAWHNKEFQQRKLVERAKQLREEMADLERVIYACGGGAEKSQA